MQSIITELKKIHTQYTVPLAVMLSLRSRIEKKRGIADRIGSVFPNGCRGVLLSGRAGTGKTTSIREIFDGLKLESQNSEGRQVGKWFSSAGYTTAPGLLAMLALYNNSIVFMDELSLDTQSHIGILKQIANGELLHQKYENIESIPFDGMVIAATNGIRVPRGNSLEHLLAVMDRFVVIKVKPQKTSPEGYMDDVLSGNKEKAVVNWSTISSNLLNNNYTSLSDAEQELLSDIWATKSTEILDPSRSQYRNCHYARDIFVFIKRFFNIDSLVDNIPAQTVINDMIDDTIIFNPVSVLWLSPIEETIYNTISSKQEISLQEIVSACDTAGQSVSVKHIHSIINTMISNLIIYRTRHAKYSARRSVKSTTKEIQNTVVNEL